MGKKPPSTGQLNTGDVCTITPMAGSNAANKSVVKESLDFVFIN